MLVETIMEEKDTLSYIEKLTDEELARLQLRIANIIDARAEEKRKALIENFKEAFSALQNAHIDVNIEYFCEDCGYHDYLHVDLDDIYFDYD